MHLLKFIKIQYFRNILTYNILIHTYYFIIAFKNRLEIISVNLIFIDLEYKNKKSQSREKKISIKIVLIKFLAKYTRNVSFILIDLIHY